MTIRGDMEAIIVNAMAPEQTDDATWASANEAANNILKWLGSADVITKIDPGLRAEYSMGIDSIKRVCGD